jgi:hypothetical protein
MPSRGDPPPHQLDDMALLVRVIAASGLSNRQWAEQVAMRDERTIRRWLSGQIPIPATVRKRLLELDE